jgi:hypothetical protein
MISFATAASPNPVTPASVEAAKATSPSTTQCAIPDMIVGSHCALLVQFWNPHVEKTVNFDKNQGY